MTQELKYNGMGVLGVMLMVVPGVGVTFNLFSLSFLFLSHCVTKGERRERNMDSIPFSFCPNRSFVTFNIIPFTFSSHNITLTLGFLGSFPLAFYTYRNIPLVPLLILGNECNVNLI